MCNPCSRNICHYCRGIRVVQLCLGLSFESRIRMLYRNNGCHSVSHVKARKIGVLFLKDAEFSCVLINDRRKFGLKTGYMGTTLLGKNGITKSKDIFLKNIYKLKCYLNFYIICCFRESHYITYCFFTFVQFSYIGTKTVRLIETFFKCRFRSFVLKIYFKIRIQINCLVKSGSDHFRLEYGFFKYLIIR